MLNKLKPSVRSYIHDDNIYKRYLRPEEASKIFGLDESRIIQFASAAGAIYQLPRILLILHQRLEDYMKHLYKVHGTNKLVHKKYVRIGEGYGLISRMMKSRILILMVRIYGLPIQQMNEKKWRNMELPRNLSRSLAIILPIT